MATSTEKPKRTRKPKEAAEAAPAEKHLKAVPDQAPAEEPAPTPVDEAKASRSRAEEDLKQVVGAIQQLEEERKEIGQAIKEQYDLAEVRGYDKAALKEVVRLLKMDGFDRELHYSQVNTYLQRLGHEQLRLAFEDVA